MRLSSVGLLPSVLTPSRAPSNTLVTSSRTISGFERPMLLEFPFGWDRGLVMEWYNRQRDKGSMVIEKLHLRRGLLAPYHHTYIVVFTRGGPIYRVDRRPDPNTPFDTIMRTGCKTYDTIQSLESRSLQELEQTSDCVVELLWQGEQTIDLLFVLSVCFALKQDERAKQYTLQRYNCYFLSWAIVMIAARDTAAWETRLDAALSNLAPHLRNPGEDVVARDREELNVECQELLKRAREQALGRALQELQRRTRALKKWRWSLAVVLVLAVGPALMVASRSMVMSMLMVVVVGAEAGFLLLIAWVRHKVIRATALVLVIMTGLGLAGYVKLCIWPCDGCIWSTLTIVFFDLAMFLMGVVAQALLEWRPRQAQQQERQQACQRLERLQLGGQRQEKELARELSGDLARELAKEMDPQKALLSTQQWREKVWKKVMDAVREAVDQIRELTSLARSNDLERASPLIQRYREEVRREAIDVVRKAVDTALGLGFNTPEDNSGARTGFILNRTAQHVCNELREVMLQSANPISRMLSPTELVIWQSTIVQAIQSMLFDMWYVQ